MNRFVAAATVLLAGASWLTMTPAAQADRAQQPVLTVSSTAPASWGVALATRQWNKGRVDGQPRLVLVPADGDVQVRTVSRPKQWWSGSTRVTADHVSIDLNLASINNADFRVKGSLDTAKHWTTSHEFGHALGLPHNNVARSVMSYSGSWARTAGLPDAYDYRQLARLYR